MNTFNGTFKYLIILLFFTYGCASVKWKEAGYVAHTLDCAQTYSIYHDDRFTEANPLFKDHSDGWMGICAGGYLVHYGMNETDLAPYWNPMFTLMKFGVVHRNHQLGVEIKF